MPVIQLANPTPDLGSMPVFPAAAVAITPGADTFSVPVTVYCGGAGNVTILPAGGGAAIQFVGIPAGGVVPCQAIGVTAATATSLVGIY